MLMFNVILPLIAQLRQCW